MEMHCWYLDWCILKSKMLDDWTKKKSEFLNFRKLHKLHWVREFSTDKNCRIILDLLLNPQKTEWWLIQLSRSNPVDPAEIWGHPVNTSQSQEQKLCNVNRINWATLQYHVDVKTKSSDSMDSPERYTSRWIYPDIQGDIQLYNNLAIFPRGYSKCFLRIDWRHTVAPMWA